MTYSNLKKQEKAFLIGIALRHNEDVGPSLSELTDLAKTAGLEVVGSDWQFVREINPATILGSGKVEEIKEEVKDCDVVVVDFELTGSQCRNLEEVFGVKTIDRIALILDIFAQRAISSEGKLQVKLALCKYMMPRLSQMSGSAGRFGGAGVGMRGPGETKLELDRRAVKKEIEMLSSEIEKIKLRREINRTLRNKNEKKKVAIVGYTNAGKSTLLNLLTRENIYADNKLFATLDTTSRNLFLTEKQNCIITDTVGFINKLPHSLVDAFSATLEEAKDADVILHVVDASNPQRQMQIEVVNKVLGEIGVKDIPTIVAYNKCDNVSEEIVLQKNEILISAKKNIGIDILKEKLIKMLFNN